VGVAAAAVTSAVEDILRRRGSKARIDRVPIDPSILTS